MIIRPRGKDPKRRANGDRLAFANSFRGNMDGTKGPKGF